MDKDNIDVLLIGTFAGGGIDTYVTELSMRLKLEPSVSINVHDAISYQNRSSILDGVLLFLQSIWAAVSMFSYKRPDIVHIHTSQYISFYRSILYVILAKVVWGSVVIVHIHGSSFDEFMEGSINRHIIRFSLKFTDEVIVLSEYWAEHLKQICNPGNITVVSNAVDTKKYNPKFDNGGSIVYLSGLSKRKGILILLEAVSDLPDYMNYHLTIAGKGKLSEKVRSFSDNHSNVKYLGFVTEETKRELLDNGDIFVLPTAAEGQPIAILEAMAGGNAIVSTPVGAIPEVIADDNGVIINRSATELACVLESLLKNPNSVAQMGRKNVIKAKANYDWTIVSEIIINLYRKNIN